MNMRASKGGVMEWNLKAVLIICLTAALLFYFFWPLNSSGSSLSSERGHSVIIHDTWKSKAFVSIPQDVLDRQSQVKIEERRVAFEFEGEDLGISIREAGTTEGDKDKDLTVVLLHGMAFTSKTWQDLGTLSFIAAMGYKVEALDLPGWGQSDKDKSIKNKGDFLARYLKHRGIDRPVIVSPSMSGGYSIPYLMGSTPATCLDRVRGFVPVAPVGTDSYTHAQYHRCEAPTMIVYGTEDTGLGLTSLGNLRNMPNRAIEAMEKQGHACYLKKPDEWHYLLYNFLLAVEREHN